MEKSSKIPKIYNCEICDYNTRNKKDIAKHLLTRKHLYRTELNEKIPKNEGFACPNCNKIYKAKNSLWYHSKKCKPITNYDSDNNHSISNHSTEYNSEDEDESDYSDEHDPDEYDDDDISEYGSDYEKNSEKIISKLDKYDENIKKYNNPNINEHLTLITELLKQNQELQKQILEISKEGRNYISNTTNNNNSKHFNLNVFLNERCKDAINLMDFVNSLQVQLSEFEATGRLGYVEGISNIVINRLKSMDVGKRPIHCTDSKRETMYIKDDDTWEKEESHRPRLSKALKIVADKNFQQMLEWQKVYPECVINNTKENDYFFKIVASTLGGDTPEEDIKNRDKIIRNIAKVVTIDKELYQL